MPLELAGPFVEWLDGIGVCAIQHLTAVASRFDKSDIVQHAEVLGDRRLRESELGNDVADGTLARREVVENVASSRLGDGVERIGGCGGSRHG